MGWIKTGGDRSETKSRLLHGCKKLEMHRNTWQEWKQKRCEEKRTTMCKNGETSMYSKEEQSGYDSHPAQAKTETLLVPHYATIISAHTTSESELKKTPQTTIACKSTWETWCKMSAVCLNPKLSEGTALQGVNHQRDVIAFKISESCWVVKSTEVIPGYPF